MGFAFAVELKKARISTRKSQRDFALLCDVNSSTYKAWESGRSVPNFENFEKLYSALEELGIMVGTLERVYNNEKLGVLKNEVK